MKRIFSLCLVFLLVSSAMFPVHAVGSVTYDTDANKFIFAPGTEDSLTNLFGNFQNVMPGDTLTEQILIKNDTSNGVKIKVYMRSLGAQENTDDFLSQMNLTVQQKEDDILFDAPADETAQLTDWVFLGTVYSGGDITLDVTLEVPITMSSDFQNQVGYIDWEFKVEELPIESTDPEAPHTGDNINLTMYIVLVLVCFATLVILLTAARNKHRKRNV